MAHASAILTTFGDFSRILQSLRRRFETHRSSTKPDTLSSRVAEIFLRTWDLGFVAFGGPAVHFQILHQRFVEGGGGKEKWVDEQTYQELFALTQGLPGPATTKMIFWLALMRGGLVPAVMAFLLFCLPGAIGMYSLSLGVQRMKDSLPLPVYALLSGLNSASVGVIALAAVQLAERAIRDKATRILVLLGACAGVCYNALWYFPTLMAIGGIALVVWDGWMRQKIAKVYLKISRKRKHSKFATDVELNDGINLENPSQPSTVIRIKANASVESSHSEATAVDTETPPGSHTSPKSQGAGHTVGVRTGVPLLLLFLALFTCVMVVRGVLKPLPLVFSLFSNLLLAGTIIFGGGPVVIPLLRTYIVEPGWVSSRDFLIGLAIIQAFPGPNFNFAVYLGTLALRNSEYPIILGAIVGFLGIYFPGMILAFTVQSFWGILRRKKWVIDLLRGVNATAVGLVFTAVYRLWRIGFVTVEANQGQSLGLEPWWVVVAAVAYSGSAWFNVPPALAIIIGAILGLCWYAATS